MDGYITAGEFANLAHTTKRTILYYDEQGVIKPIKVDHRGYRYYNQNQILDYQMVLLLTSLRIPLKTIKTHLDTKGTLKELFFEMRPQITKEISTLKTNLKNVDAFLNNIKNNQTMITPRIRWFNPLEVYYIEKVGAYTQIGQFCTELAKMFEKTDKSFVTMAIFDDPGYRPKTCHIKIAAFGNRPLKVKNQYVATIKKMTFAPGKVISYTHHGPGEMLSLFWKELEKYCQLKRIKARPAVPDFEIYWKVDPKPTNQLFEIFLPIESMGVNGH